MSFYSQPPTSQNKNSNHQFYNPYQYNQPTSPYNPYSHSHHGHHNNHNGGSSNFNYNNFVLHTSSYTSATADSTTHTSKEISSNSSVNSKSTISSNNSTSSQYYYQASGLKPFDPMLDQAELVELGLACDVLNDEFYLPCHPSRSWIKCYISSTGPGCYRMYLEGKKKVRFLLSAKEFATESAFLISTHEDFPNLDSIPRGGYIARLDILPKEKSFLLSLNQCHFCDNKLGIYHCGRQHLYSNPNHPTNSSGGSHGSSIFSSSRSSSSSIIDTNSNLTTTTTTTMSTKREREVLVKVSFAIQHLQLSRSQRIEYRAVTVLIPNITKNNRRKIWCPRSFRISNPKVITPEVDVNRAIALLKEMNMRCYSRKPMVIHNNTNNNYSNNTNNNSSSRSRSKHGNSKSKPRSDSQLSEGSQQVDDHDHDDDDEDLGDEEYDDYDDYDDHVDTLRNHHQQQQQQQQQEEEDEEGKLVLKFIGNRVLIPSARNFLLCVSRDDLPLIATKSRSQSEDSTYNNNNNSSNNNNSNSSAHGTRSRKNSVSSVNSTSNNSNNNNNNNSNNRSPIPTPTKTIRKQMSNNSIDNKQSTTNNNTNTTMSNESIRPRTASFRKNSFDEEEIPILQFGKATKTRYVVDFKFPLSPIQAFGIALASFAADKLFNTSNELPSQRQSKTRKKRDSNDADSDDDSASDNNDDDGDGDDDCYSDDLDYSDHETSSKKRSHSNDKDSTNNSNHRSNNASSNNNNSSSSRHHGSIKQEYRKSMAKDR